MDRKRVDVEWRQGERGKESEITWKRERQNAECNADGERENAEAEGKERDSRRGRHGGAEGRSGRKKETEGGGRQSIGPPPLSTADANAAALRHGETQTTRTARARAGMRAPHSKARVCGVEHQVWSHAACVRGGT